ncbi:MAG: L-rhamnose/proton symporter RhaT [Kiritimatiellae bacterium]|nr:L-rhamnose/proton symporter RhaT [Kiritimatiellia bacterium]
MESNPFLGVMLHAIGGLAAASFYIPYKRVKGWAWENYWLAGGFFSWIVAPWVLAMIILPQTPAILGAAPGKALFWTWFFGVLWGIGGLTFGLTMRYLGIALGYAIALGLCAAFGTLVPPIFKGEFMQILTTGSGQVILLGVVVCLGGIALSGKAGISKERELSDEQKQESVTEFSFVKGVIVAIIAGMLSAAMAYAFAAGKPIAEAALAQGAPPLWQNLPILIVALFGGFVTNCIWCLGLSIKNKTWGEYFGKVANHLPARDKETIIETVTDAPGEEMAEAMPQADTGTVTEPPLLRNYIFCALGGVTWYLQFFFYGMGSTQMGAYDFSSWTLHMASIIIFSTIWGIALKEWKGTSKATHMWIALGLVVLILSTMVIGYGNTLGAGATGH